MRNFGIVMLSHGEFAKATLGSLEMIAGKQEGVIALVLDENKSSDQLKEELLNAVNAFNSQYENTLVLSDLYGGTPFNKSLSLLLEGSDCIAFSGFNLPVALSVCLAGELDREGIKSLVIETFSQSLFDLEELVVGGEESSDTDL